MPSNITGKLYLGDILLCGGDGVIQECKGPYAPYNATCVFNFNSIIYNQYNNIDADTTTLSSISYKQLYIYNSGLS